MTNDELRDRITAAENALAEASKLAVSQAASPTALRKQAKLLLEQREVLKLLRAQLAAAEKTDAENQARLDQERRLAARQLVAELSEKVVADAAVLSKEIATAARRFHKIHGYVGELMQAAKNAADIDYNTLQTMKPIDRPYNLAINLIAQHFGFGPRHPLDHWPAQHRVDAGAMAALAPFAQLAEWPKEPQPEEPVEYVEATPKEMSDVV
jgi:hypothetical protein